MAADRRTRVRASQVKDADLTKADLTAVGETTGYVLTVQADGSVDWEIISASSGSNIQDTDGDTKVETEATADEDTVKITTFGTLRATIDANGLKLETGADVTEFSIDGTLAGNSDDAVPTEKAVKTYVDSQTSGGSFIEDADGDTKIQTEESADEDIIRFDIAGIEQIRLQDGVLIPTTNNDIDLGSSSAGFKDLYLTSGMHIGLVDITEDSWNKKDYNIMLNAFRIAINGSLTQFNMVDGIIDEYEDESGINTGASINESYNSSGDYYSPASSPETKTLLHMNGADASTTFTDATANHTWTAFVNAQIDTAESKFGGASGLFDGSSYITAPDSDDWSWNRTNMTVDFWAKFNDHSGLNYIINQAEDGVTRWSIVHNDGTGFIFFTSTNSSDISMAGGGEVTDSNWHHIAIIKVGTDYGTYVDGTQVNYHSSSDTPDNISAVLEVGRKSFTTPNYFNGWLDDFRVIHSNYFSAAPVVGLTDTITVPTSEAIIATDMTLISNNFTAETQPDLARIVVFEEDIDTITENTDFTAEVSRDGGTTYTSVTLTDQGNYETGKRILAGTVDISGQPSGTSMKYRLKTLNTKDLNVHGTALSWD